MSIINFISIVIMGIVLNFIFPWQPILVEGFGVVGGVFNILGSHVRIQRYTPGTRYRVWYTNESLSIIVHFLCHHHASFCNAQFIFITSSLCSSIVGFKQNKPASATPITNAIKRATYSGTASHLYFFDSNVPFFYTFIYA